MGMSRRSLFALILLLAIVLGIVLVHQIGIVQGSLANNIVIRIKVIDEKGNDITSKVRLYAQMWIIGPPTIKHNLIEIYRGAIEPTIKIPCTKKILKAIAEEWISFLKKMKASLDVLKSYKTAIGLAVWIVNKTNYEVIHRYFDFIPISPFKILNKIGKFHDIVIRVDTRSRPVKEVRVGPCDGGTCEWVLVWERQWIKKPEDNPDIFGNDKRVVNSVVYVKTPILFIYNECSVSATIRGFIEILVEQTTYFRASVAISYKIEKKLKSGDWTGGLSGKITVTSSTVSVTAAMARSIDVYPGEKKCVYIWTHPVVSFWKEKKIKCCGAVCYDGEYTGYEMVSGYTDHILIRGSRIIHGTSQGDLPNWMRSYFYNAVREEKIVIPDYETISDGKLDPGEELPLQIIITWWDKYDTNIEIGLPLALLSRIVPSHFAKLVGAFSIVLSYGKSVLVTIGGGLENHGRYNNKGYDVPEIIYLKVSRLKYTYRGHVFRVPFGIYFRCF